MAFISVAEELTKRTTTAVENKFIIKYLAELEPMAVKAYLYALYLVQNGQTACTLGDLAVKLNISEDDAKGYFEYLSEFELVAITSYSPFEIKILDCDNSSGRPKRLNPEKYAGLYEELQDILSGRMISQSEFREYLILLEDYGFERNALIMIITYCVNLKGNDIGAAYIKKVAKSFSEDGATSARQVEEKLAFFTASKVALKRLYEECGSTKTVASGEDSAYYSKWVKSGYDLDRIICVIKCFKAKKFSVIDGIIEELSKNNIFEEQDILAYSEEKRELQQITKTVGKSLGVYISDAAPYIGHYVSKWKEYGYSQSSLKVIADYCFTCGKNNFGSMDNFVTKLFEEAIIDNDSVLNAISNLTDDDAFLKNVLSACGIESNVKASDRQALIRWRSWGFGDEMILKAAELSYGKGNPLTHMNNLFSYWKASGIFSIDKITDKKDKSYNKTSARERDMEVYRKLYAKLAEEDNDE